MFRLKTTTTTTNKQTKWLFFSHFHVSLYFNSACSERSHNKENAREKGMAKQWIVIGMKGDEIGKQRWRSGESSGLPPVWPEFRNQGVDAICGYGQESITRSLHMHRTLESSLSRIFLFLALWSLQGLWDFPRNYLFSANVLMKPKRWQWVSHISAMIGHYKGGVWNSYER